jgi:murein DD-endopeptidase MepM/ murein hydrolase activator NlpD
MIRRLLLFLLLPGWAWAQTPYPEVQTLSPSDPLFKQQQDLVDLAYQALADHRDPGDLTLFQYRFKGDDSLFTVAARFNVPYDAIATLNGLEHASADLSGRTMLIPSQPGLFLSLDHPSELDRLLDAWRASLTDAPPGVQLKLKRPGGTETLLFFSGERFHPLERAFFLGILFRFPLPKAVLTSSFGIRANPFTGHPTFHAGIDLAAPTGTDVYAARDGVVVEIGTNDRIYGNFVRLDHGDGYETVYGHLSAVLVSLHQQLRSGTILGKVGSTGMSTGPHLHFEIRRKGHPEDPVPLLPGRR